MILGSAKGESQLVGFLEVQIPRSLVTYSRSIQIGKPSAGKAAQWCLFGTMAIIWCTFKVQEV